METSKILFKKHDSPKLITTESSLSTLVFQARQSDAGAFGEMVRRFQDMAVGYGYSILNDFQAAEDAAQEAFLDAFRNLNSLREPAAFPGWFRRIVFKHCNRITRRPPLTTVPLEALEEWAASNSSPFRETEHRELKDRLLKILATLPKHERSAVTLYYLGEFSLKDVVTFLGVPESTVKKRLHSARARLRKQLMLQMGNDLRQRRPSRDKSFATSVMAILNAARHGQLVRLKRLLEKDPRLLRARDPMGNTAMILAANSGHHEIVELLLASGVRPGLHEAAAMGRTDLVREMLKADPKHVNSFSPEGFTPLVLAAHFGSIETARFLIRQGADLNAVSKHPIQVTPLHAALFGQKIEMAQYLIRQGADVTIKRGGKTWPRSGWTALHYAARLGLTSLLKPILAHGGDVNAQDDQGKTPAQVAVEFGHDKMAASLRQTGASH